MDWIKKYWYILISFELYNNYYDDIYEVFKKFKPVYMDYNYANRVIKMYWTCEDFKELQEWEITPQYDAVLKRNDDWSKEISFILLNNTNVKTQTN